MQKNVKLNTNVHWFRSYWLQGDQMMRTVIKQFLENPTAENKKIMFDRAHMLGLRHKTLYPEVLDETVMLVARFINNNQSVPVTHSQHQQQSQLQHQQQSQQQQQQQLRAQQQHEEPSTLPVEHNLGSDEVNEDVPQLHIAEEDSVAESEERSTDLRTPSPVMLEDQEITITPDKHMPVIDESAPEKHDVTNNTLNKNYQENFVFKYLEKTLQKKSLKQVESASNNFCEMLNAESSVEQFLSLLESKKKDETFFNSLLKKLEANLSDFVTLLKMNVFSVDKIHWALSDVVLVDGRFQIKKKGSVNSSREDETPVQHEATPRESLADVPAVQTPNMINLDFQQHAEWAIEAESMRTVTAIFTSKHIIFLSSAFHIPRNLQLGYTFKNQLFPDGRSGKVFVPGNKKLETIKFKIVDNLHDFEELFLNKQNVMESNAIFLKSLFQALSLQFMSFRKSVFKITPKIINPVTESSDPTNCSQQILSNIFGVVETVDEFRGVVECTHSIPGREDHKYDFQLSVFTVLMRDYCLVFPSSEVSDYFYNYIYCGEQISAAECRVDETKILKIKFPINNKNQAVELRGRPTEIRTSEILSLQSPLETECLAEYMRFVEAKKEFALKLADWMKLRKVSRDLQTVSILAAFKCWFHVESVEKVFLKSDQVIIVTLDSKSQEGNSLLSDTSFRSFKYVVQKFETGEGNLESVNYQSGVYMQRQQQEVFSVKWTTKDVKPHFKEEKLRFIENGTSLIWAVDGKESCICNQESIGNLLKKVKHSELVYGSKRLVTEMDSKTAGSSPRFNIVSAARPSLPSMSRVRSPAIKVCPYVKETIQQLDVAKASIEEFQD